MFNLFPKKKTVDELVSSVGPFDIYRPVQTPSYLQAQQELNNELLKENIELKPDWQCPCNKCKANRENKHEASWEEAASDLALRVVKLERKVEELTLINSELIINPLDKCIEKYGD